MKHSIEAEQVVLGSLLVYPETWHELRATLSADAYFEPLHGIIWNVVGELVSAGRAPIPSAVEEGINRAGGATALKQLGGTIYLSRLASVAVSPRLVNGYAEIVSSAAAWRHAATVARSIIEMAENDALSEDPAEAIANAIADLGAVLGNDRRSRPISSAEAIKTLLEEVGDRDSTGIPVSNPYLAEVIPSWREGQLVLLAARPSMGKTAFAAEIAALTARAGYPVVFASLEMPPHHVAARIASSLTPSIGRAIAYRQLMDGNIPGDREDVAKAAIEEAARLPITYLSSEHQAIEALQAGLSIAVSEIANRTNRRPLVIIDYAQLIRAPGRSAYEQASAVALALKEIAMRNRVPILSLAQLSRQVESREDKRPRLSDLRDTGRFEEAADAIAFLYRPAYYLEREEPTGTDFDEFEKWRSELARTEYDLEVIVAKNRNGPIGIKKSKFNTTICHSWR